MSVTITTLSKYMTNVNKENGTGAEIAPVSTLSATAPTLSAHMNQQSVSESEPTRRGVLDKVFGALGYTGIVEGLYNASDRDKNTNFVTGLGEGFKYMSPTTNDVTGKHTFSDVLENWGWKDKNPNKLSLSDVGRGVVGFAGDVLLDPLTYLNPYGAISKVVKGTGIGTDVARELATIGKVDDIVKEINNVTGAVDAGNVSRIKKLDFDTAKKIVMDGPVGQRSEDEINLAAQQLVDSFNTKVLKLAEGGEGLTFGTKYVPFSNKINVGDKTLASFNKELISSKQLRELGDKTIAPYYNDLAKKLRTSRIGSKFNSLATFERMADESVETSAALFHAKQLLTGADRISLDVDDIKNAAKIQEYFEGLDEASQNAFLDAIETGAFDNAIAFKTEMQNARKALGLSDEDAADYNKLLDIINSWRESPDYKSAVGEQQFRLAMKSFGQEGFDIAELVINRMKKAAQAEVDRGLLDKNAAEYRDGKYLMHINMLNKEAFDKLLETDNNGVWNPDILGFIKDYNHQRKINGTIAQVNTQVGEKVLENALHEIYLTRSLGSNRLIFGHDTQKFIDKNFAKEIVDGVIEDGYKPVASYKDIDKKIRDRAVETYNDFKKKAKKDEEIPTIEDIIDVLRTEFIEAGTDTTKVTFAPNVPMQELTPAQIKLLKDKYELVPKQMREEVLAETNQLSRKQQQELTSDTLNLYDRLLTIWKLNNTLVMPGFHIQNAVSNAFQSFLGISEDAFNPKKLKRAYTVFTNPDPKQVMKVGDKEYTYKELNYMATKLGVIDEMFHTFEFKRDGEGGMIKGLPKGLDPTDVEGFVLNKIGTEVGTKIEGTQRMNLWLSCLERGNTPEHARDIVNKYLFDYSDLTDFEQQTVKRIIPFYTFMKKNAPMELEAMLNQPQKFSQLQKGITNFEKMGGDYKGENERNEWRQEYIQIPNTGYGVADQLPYNQLERIVDPQKILGQTSPLIKTPIEMMTGDYIYTGIDIGGPIEYLANQTAPTKVAYNTLQKDSILDKLLYATGQLSGFPIGEIK